MEKSADIERRELRALVERVKKGSCVLVLGPRIAVRAGDAERRPLDELLAAELVAGMSEQGKEPPAAPMDLRRAADDYYRLCQNRELLELAVHDFYEREGGSTTDFHRDLARLPFKLCISASPDSLMLTAFQEAGKSPQKGHYSFRQGASPRLTSPTPDQPLVYHLFGHHEEPTSMVLTEGDLIQFLVSVIRGAPAVPDQVRSILADPSATFLFLGFGFQNWYLRVLLQVMNVYGRPTNAFEDAQFFADPGHEQTVGFFSGDRRIDFRPLRWDVFAQQLREIYEAGAPRKAPDAVPARVAPPSSAPKAFVSYASEDRAAVEALAEQLEARGVAIWQDKQDLRAGDDWNRVLLDVIAKRVDYVIVVQTPAMTTRIQGVFQREIQVASRRQDEMGEFQGQRLRFLVPVKIGPCQPLSSLQTAHVIDVGEPDGVDSLVQSILEDWSRRASLKSGLQAAS